MPPFPPLVRILHSLGLSPQKLVLVLSDLLALMGTAVALFLLRAAFGGLDSILYQWVMPLLLLGPVFGASLGLYQNICLPPPRELKATFLAVSLTYGLILGVLFLSRSGDMVSRLVVLGSWGLTVFLLPILRGMCRRRFSRKRWWGKPLLIFERSGGGRELWRDLKRHPERGLTPVGIMGLPDELEPVRDMLATAARRWPGAIALILHKTGRGHTLDYVTEVNRYFSNVLVVPGVSEGFKAHWLTPRDLGSVMGLLLRQNLRDKRRLRMKRCIDLFFCLLILPMLLPLGLLLGLLIRLDSPGPALYRQKRIGQDGRALHIYKFRTMCANADSALKDCLARDPELRAEWGRDHKLKNDPRITRMGTFLRKTSLDELPQLINVVAGGMSLVGPRPIVPAEIEKYGDVYEDYCRVKPGITGLWQISGRNDTSYEERVGYDSYYINNWSVWMDVWILARTVPVVLTGYGAY